jgi:hypothetical protein
VLNDVTQTLMRTHFPNWNAFHQWYRSYGEKAEAAIKEVTQAFKQFELDWWATKDSRRGSHLAVVDYIARHGFDELIKNLDINVELMDAGGTTASVGKGIGKVLAASKDAQLVVLSSEKIGSPASSRITFECTSALVLARSSDGAAWRPVAQAFPRYRRLYPFPGSDKKRVEEDEVWAIIKAKQVGIEDLVRAWPASCLSRGCSVTLRLVASERRQLGFGRGTRGHRRTSRRAFLSRVIAAVSFIALQAVR